MAPAQTSHAWCIILCQSCVCPWNKVINLWGSSLIADNTLQWQRRDAFQFICPVDKSCTSYKSTNGRRGAWFKLPRHWDHCVVLAVKMVILIKNGKDESLSQQRFLGNHGVSRWNVCGCCFCCYHSVQNCLGVTQYKKVNLCYWFAHQDQSFKSVLHISFVSAIVNYPWQFCNPLCEVNFYILCGKTKQKPWSTATGWKGEPKLSSILFIQDAKKLLKNWEIKTYT